MSTLTPPSALFVPELKKRLDAELRTDERIVWSEKLDPAVHAQRSRAVIFFAIPWLLFIGFFTYGARDSLFMLAFTAFTMPFWAAGLFMFSGRSIARRKAQRMVYALTNQRAILLCNGKHLEVTSFAADGLGDLARRERPDGSGDLVLPRELGRDSDGHAKASEPGFVGVKDVQRVERLVRELHQKS